VLWLLLLLLLYVCLLSLLFSCWLCVCAVCLFFDCLCVCLLNLCILPFFLKLCNVSFVVILPFSFSYLPSFLCLLLLHFFDIVVVFLVFTFLAFCWYCFHIGSGIESSVCGFMWILGAIVVVVVIVDIGAVVWY